MTGIQENGNSDIKALLCNVTRQGKPSLVTRYTWTRDGEPLSDHSGIGISVPQPIIKVNPCGIGNFAYNKKSRRGYKYQFYYICLRILLLIHNICSTCKRRFINRKMSPFQKHQGEKYWGTYKCYITNAAGKTSESDAEPLVLPYSVGKNYELTVLLSTPQTITEGKLLVCISC